MADANLRIIISALTEDVKKSLGDLRKDLADLNASLDKIKGQSTDKLSEGLSNTEKATKKATEALQEHAKHLGGIRDGVHTLVEGFGKLVEVLQFVAGGFLAIEAVRMAKDVLDVAARTETLGIVMQVVGQNAGYTAAQLSITDHAVRQLGITAEASRESIAQLIQTGLSLNFAAPLARAAQDLAVITGVNSSETFKRLVTNIQQMDTLGLRFMGIIIDRERVFAQAAQETGKAISGNLEKTVFANAVLAESAKLTGLYTAAMESAGKQLTSMPRFVENFKDALGTGLQPVYLQLILGTQHVLEALTELAESFHQPAINADLFGDSIAGAEGKFSPLAQAVRDLADALVNLIHWLTVHKELLGTIIHILGDVAIAYIALKAALGFGALITSLGALTAGFGIMGGAAGAAVGPVALLGTAFRFLLGPIGLAITVAGLFVAAWENLGAKSKVGTDAVAKNVDELVSEYEKALQAQERLIRKNNQAQDDKRKASNQAAAEPKDKALDKASADATKEAEKTSKALEDNAKKLRKLKEELANSEELSKRDDLKAKVKELDAASQERVKDLLAEVEAQKQLSEAMAKAGESYQKYLNGIDSKTEQKIGTLRSAIQQLGHAEGSDISSGILASLELAENIATQIKTGAELKLFNARLEEMRTEALKFGHDLSVPIEALMKVANTSVATATQNLKGGGAAATTEAKNLARRQAQLEREELLGIAADHKLQQERLLEIDKAFFDRGLLNLNEYYAHRIQAVKQALVDEQAAQVAFIKGELQRREEETNPAKRIQIDKEIAQARNKLSQQANKADLDIQKLEIERLNQRLTLERQVAAVASGVNRSQGYEMLAIEQEVNAARVKELESVRQLGSEEVNNLVNRKHDLDLAQKQADQRLVDLKKELDLRTALLDLDEASLALARQRGEITSFEQEDKLNTVIRERIVLLEKEFDQTKKNRDEAAADGRVGEANAANLQLAKLQTEMVKLAGTMKDLGDSLRQSFTDSIASNLEAVLNRTKSFKQGFIDIFKDLNTQVLKNISKNFAEEITKGIDGVSGGGGLFSKLGELITGKPSNKAALDKSREDAINKETLAATAKQEKFEASKITADTLKATQDISGFTERTAKASEALVDQMKAASDKKIEDAQKPLGEVPTGVRSGQGVGAVGAPDGSFDVRGLRNNNPGNIEFMKSNPFQGQASSDGRYGVYDTAENGIRALAKNLIAKQDAHDLNTVKEVVEAWSPAKENGAASTAAYVQDVANQLKVGVDDKIDLHDKATLEAFTKAVISHENGKQPYDEQTIDNAVNRALGRPVTPITDSNPLPVDVVGGVKDSERSGWDNKPSGDMWSPPTSGSSFDDLMKFYGSKLPSLLSAVPGLGPVVGLAAKFIPQIQSLSSSSFKPNTSGVPRTGSYDTFENSGGFENTKEAVTNGTDSVFQTWGKTIEYSYSDMASTMSQGGFGLGGFFSNFGSIINSFFSAMGGGGDGGGGGSGFGSILSYGFQNLGSIFAAAEGGYVTGPGTGTSDSIPARLSNGEYVVKASATARFLPLLHAINEGSADIALRVPHRPAFALGGMVDTAALTGTAGSGKVGPAVTLIQHIHTPDANSFRRNQDQLAVDTSRSVNRALRRNT